MYKKQFKSNRPSFNRGPSRFGGGGGGRRGGGNRGRDKYINPALFVNIPLADAIAPVAPITRAFTEFALDARLLEKVAQRGYLNSTPIQDETIDHLLDGKDILGIANTGTGKTAAFLLPIINKILEDRQARALIMVPTRELALQIEKEFRLLSTGLGLFSAMCIGGTNMYRQIQDLRRNSHIVIGTPGRLKDLMQRRHLDLSRHSMVVLDEVDQMLDMGFIHDMRDILQEVPTERQSMFFSATMSRQVTDLIGNFSRNLVTVSVKKVETATTIHQDVVPYRSPEDKMGILKEMLSTEEFKKVLIFGKTKHGVNNLARKLSENGFKTDSIHGNKTQPQRQRALKNFHSEQVNILVATDVAARGLDIADVTHVINFDLPATYEDYVHRIGRTGRANKKGMALTFVAAR